MEIREFKEEVILTILEAQLLYHIYMEMLAVSNAETKGEISEQVKYLGNIISELSISLMKLEEFENDFLSKLNKLKTLH